MTKLLSWLSLLLLWEFLLLTLILTLRNEDFLKYWFEEVLICDVLDDLHLPLLDVEVFNFREGEDELELEEEFEESPL